ncbi:hypothetical protein EGW08_020290 [Elysia chlorotica]|uniref:SOCS box domain-containing protein n=1 Tax=Elysia chlorotica TaxID=188477 RepID=A0A3S1B4S3_ELYCH|nr:hypothetical protein EGW08_020290 [Elysia chlorotica]
MDALYSSPQFRPSLPPKLVDIPEFEHDAFKAVRQGSFDLLEKFLNDGFDINTKHEEILGDQIYCIKWFVRPIRLKKYSLLHMATIHADKEMLEYLISKGADVNQMDQNGFTPVSVAAAIHRPDIVDCLIQAGADLNAQSISGRTPLIQAITTQDAPIVTMLLAAGADPNLEDMKGTTPLNTAMMIVETKNVDILQALLDGGCDIEKENKMGATALMTAVGLGKHEAARVLLDAGANVNKVDANGKSVFQFAIGPKMGTMLINRGAYFDFVDKNGYRALDWAAHVGHVTMLRLLLGMDCKRPSLDIMRVPRVIQVMDSIPIFSTWIKQELGQPRNLKRICRGAIRDLLGPSGLTQVDKLPIPRLMKDFLLGMKFDLSFEGISMDRLHITAGGEGLQFMAMGGNRPMPSSMFHVPPVVNEAAQVQ